MKKISLFVLMVLVGISLFSGIIPLRADDEARTIKHKFQAYTSNTSVSQGKTIFRISGYATGANAVFGIYNVGTLAEASDANVATEGGEATSGDPIEPIDFGPDGLDLPDGSTVVRVNCTIVIEYI